MSNKNRNKLNKSEIPYQFSYENSKNIIYINSSSIINTKYNYFTNPLSANSRPKNFNHRNNNLNLSKRHYSTNDISIGERLYQKGIAKINQTQIKIKEIKEQMFTKEMSQCTFKPKTLKVVSVKLVNSKNNLLTNKFENKKLVKNKNKEKSDSQPKKKITKYKKKELMLHSLKLYNDNERLKKKRQKEMEEYFKKNYSFHPVIAKSQEKVPAKIPTLTLEKDNSTISENNFFTRLHYWLTKHVSNQMKAEEQTMYDDKTGFRLFTPHLLSKSKEHRYDKDSKFTELFDDADTRIEKNKLKESKSIDTIYKMANSTFFSPRSREIIQSLLKKIFNKIFTIISPNGEFIDKNNIMLEEIDVQVIEMFFPLLLELDKHNGSLNEEDFFSSCMEMYKTFTIYEKNILIEWYFSLLKKENQKKEIKNNVIKPKVSKIETITINSYLNNYNVSSKSNINNIGKNKKEQKGNRNDQYYCTFRSKSLSH